MKELKKALTYEEQIEKLEKEHGLLIEDISQAIEILKSVNYYRLSGYGIGLKDINNRERYKQGVSFDLLFNLYKFDSELRNIIIYAIEQIEIQFRSRIAYQLATKYGAEGYISKNNFIEKKRKEEDEETIHYYVMKHFNEECSRQRNTPFVRHHIINYKGRFPIWVAVELFTFGNLSSLYSIMLEDDKRSISKLYNTHYSKLISWVLCLVEVRNICAHYGRLYNMPLKQTPSLFTEHISFRDSINKINRLFPVILVIRYILYDDHGVWNKFYQRLSELIDNNLQIINMSFIGFPSNWKIILEAIARKNKR